MANYKKKKPVSSRGHCKLCHYWKINGIARDNPIFEKFSDHKRRMFSKMDIKENEN